MKIMYDGNAAKRMVEQILKEYIPEFQKVQNCILETYGKILESL